MFVVALVATTLQDYFYMAQKIRLFIVRKWLVYRLLYCVMCSTTIMMGMKTSDIR